MKNSGWYRNLNGNSTERCFALIEGHPSIPEHNYHDVLESRFCWTTDDNASNRHKVATIPVESESSNGSRIDLAGWSLLRASRATSAGRRPPPFGIALQMTLLASRSEEHTSELQSLRHLVCRLLLEKKKKK